MDIQWTPGNANNDPITEFAVYYNTSLEPDLLHLVDTFVSNVRVTRIAAIPWVDYTFYVTASNSLGTSQRSVVSQTCSTPQDRPYRNPDGVCVLSEDPTKLIIVWKVSQCSAEFYW